MFSPFQACSSRKVVSRKDLKVNPGQVVRQPPEIQRPDLLPRHARDVAVRRSVVGNESNEAARSFVRAIMAGLADLKMGRRFSLAEVKARLDTR